MAETPINGTPAAGVDGADRIRQARLDKLARLESAGVRAYPTSFKRTHLAAEIRDVIDLRVELAVVSCLRMGCVTVGANGSTVPSPGPRAAEKARAMSGTPSMSRVALFPTCLLANVTW